ncbi:hypothetical protein BI084_gp86 [Gordonia phage Terapin]|uniref:Uncharacterized protein n=5 Tax=Terapinvirus terapin TaxID=2734283 RepID=A0A345MBC5_9CAUD|nr:hypothetical protein BI084_gp86 [Gordonia phage Terapin]AVP43362.1 hypothetical protein PBI_DJOKOVIC_85 [Gordonia phage Djokovic]AXH67796.1 hypothetical protein SEA_BEYONCAGE_85 [Gordonia phage Beyoncage]QOC56230.1 hypothetical protein SEA_SIENNA_85 [Gordonia phage Sienna]QOC56655.1 hypothetical protein SEA_BITESIZE_85 [Gordonia phage BiteSize]QYW00887.1 hypothetical protein SEA_MADI_84 [Gordonia phage Madi]
MSDRPGEFSYGDGLMAPPSEGRVYTPYERMRAMRATDPANPEANEDDALLAGATQSHIDPVTGLHVPGTLDAGVTPLVKESGPPPRVGQHARIDPSRYNQGHDPEGMQDGEGQAWRDSVPPNPVV